jgi:hypothetical protein
MPAYTNVPVAVSGAYGTASPASGWVSGAAVDISAELTFEYGTSGTNELFYSEITSITGDHGTFYPTTTTTYNMHVYWYWEIVDKYDDSVISSDYGDGPASITVTIPAKITSFTLSPTPDPQNVLFGTPLTLNGQFVNQTSGTITNTYVNPNN